MIKFMLALSLLALATPGFAQDATPAAATGTVEVTGPDGKVYKVPAGQPITFVTQTSADRRRARDKTGSSSLIGRPEASLEICGVDVNIEFISADNLMGLMDKYAKCTREDTLQLVALGNIVNQDTALRMGREFISEDALGAMGATGMPGTAKGVAYSYGDSVQLGYGGGYYSGYQVAAFDDRNTENAMNATGYQDVVLETPDEPVHQTSPTTEHHETPVSPKNSWIEGLKERMSEAADKSYLGDE